MAKSEVRGNQVGKKNQIGLVHEFHGDFVIFHRVPVPPRFRDMVTSTLILTLGGVAESDAGNVINQFFCCVRNHPQ